MFFFFRYFPNVIAMLLVAAVIAQWDDVSAILFAPASDSQPAPYGSPVCKIGLAEYSFQEAFLTGDQAEADDPNKNWHRQERTDRPAEGRNADEHHDHAEIHRIARPTVKTGCRQNS
jgi:hypothetical protein